MSFSLGPGFAKGHQRSSGSKGKGSADSGRGGRDRAKSDAMRAALGSPRPVTGQPSKTHLLIIDGGGHEAFIGDFIMLKDFFQKQISVNFGGEFFTCYGPQQYFTDPENSQYEDIKFGGKSILSKWSVLHQEPDYEYIKPNEICHRLYQWIDQKTDSEHANYAKPGDAVAIIILAHGVLDRVSHYPKGMDLGGTTLLVDEFVSAIDKISRDVQVNVISTACYSAIFADKIKYDGQPDRWVQVASQPNLRAFPADRSVSGRYQNSSFFQGFIKSLANLGPQNTITLEKLQSNLEDATLSPKNVSFHSQPYGYSTASLDTQVAALLLRKFADFPMIAENKMARARIELNIDYLRRNFPKSAASSTSSELSFALDVIKDEHADFGSQDTSPDEGKFEQVTRTDSGSRAYAADILKGMLIRGRLQMACLETFLHLCLSGKCSLKALELPVKFQELPIPGTAGYWVQRALLCFVGLQNDWQEAQKLWSIDRRIRWINYVEPVIWLTTMITRSAVNLQETFSHIRITGTLGVLVPESYQILPPYEMQWNPEPNYKVGKNPSMSYTFAFWLPDGVELKDDFGTDAATLLKNFTDRLSRVEEAYRRCFQLDDKVFRQFDKEEGVDPRDWSAEGFAWGPAV